MGNQTSILSDQEQRDLIQAASFTRRDIMRIYGCFKALDTNQNGELDPHELFDMPEIADNPLVKRVISIFDTNEDGKVSFVEFVIGLARLMAGSDPEQKMKFAFDIYDVNKDGWISNGELFKVMKMMVGDNLEDIQLQQLVDRCIIQADKDGDGLISYDEFREVVAHLDISGKLNLELQFQ
ncbi:calcineurin subunit B [Cryptosporidium andersoni]|uniref:Calcineurin subunit B n=1 Tax=Cryptosporidium andersoni TaxID=117008 RepID=A0A1J4MB78_9CRYT|nr:calcineurin subunit B [Cryptosporidium andersoni]